MASENILELTDGNFDELIITSGKVALVDFWAEWCMPCRMLTPVIDELATEYAGKVIVGKVNTDDNREVSMKFGITSIPTLLLFSGGQLVKKLVGLQGKKDIKAAIDSLLE